LRLVSLVEDARATAAEITRPERRWLRRAEPHGRVAGNADGPAVSRVALD
jgi:hypothetical protein